MTENPYHPGAELAKPLVAGKARKARSTSYEECRHDSTSHPLASGAGGRDNSPDKLVAEHEGKSRAIGLACHDVKIRAAYSAGVDSHQYLPRLGNGFREVSNLQSGRRQLSEHGRDHVAFPPTVGLTAPPTGMAGHSTSTAGSRYERARCLVNLAGQPTRSAGGVRRRHRSPLLYSASERN